MNSLILCEGATDAILLSYYLSRVSGWQYTKKAPHGMNIRVREDHGETANWYMRGQDKLLICAVGSKDSFGGFFDRYIEKPLKISEVETFSKIVLVIDRDDETESVLESKIAAELPIVAESAKNSVWVEHSLEGAFQESRKIQFLLLIVPPERQGALETLLLDAISEDPYDKNIVEKCKAFVEGIAPEAQKYIGSRRLRLKAYLGVTWAIQSPQKVFRFIDDQLKETPWEKSQTLRDTFQRLEEL